MTAQRAPDVAEQDVTVLAVPGMHCAGCMSKVERALGGTDGVCDARVNLSARLVTIHHDPKIDTRRLVNALDAIGFEAQVRRDELARPVTNVRPLLAPLAVAAFAAMNVMLLSVSVWSGASGATRELFHWISAAIALPAIAYSGQPFFRSAWKALRHWTTNMDVPISIGIVTATGLSLYEVATFGPHAWFDGALMLITFLLAGRVLDAMMRDRARSGVDALLSQAAQGATVVGEDGTLAWKDAAALAPGMVMRVAAGERLAADGEIVVGRSRFDQSLLTGETVPVAAGEGDQTLAGTLNLDAPVDVRVSHAGRDTTLAEIARLMEASTQNRSRYVRIADRAARLYAPAVHSLAALTVIGWLFAGAGLYQALVYGVAVLIITCPCALGLAVPVAQVVASGALMRAGIMVKDGSALERVAAVDRALFDKTGTLTLGRPTPDATALSALPADAASVALALASHSRHPLSRALADSLAAADVRAAPLEQVEERAGDGVFAVWQGRPVALRRPERAGGIAVSLDLGGGTSWLVPYVDRLRPDVTETLARLDKLGVESSIVSGDNEAAVGEVSRATRLPAQAGVSPAGKQQAIAALQAEGRTVLMVGDGLNDGPALAAANASIAPGSASDVGLQAADFVFVQDSLVAVPRTIQASRRTMAVVRQNFGLAIVYNVLAVPLAIAGLVTPLVAAIAMSASSLIVVANSLRLVRAAK
ncbi:MAG: cadmium-translocating P-type ATPase [Sphingomonadales bacterium]|nr:cadmium-translocating P-type ATPase [Sphingomonadales bacterium]MBD3774079.1 cadmium-translocating P-type ATPase [Paracoccaceae bacterium]